MTPKDDSIIWQSKNFYVIAEQRPLIDRKDGGHIVVLPKKRISTRQELSARQAIEFMRLTMVVGEAMTTVLNNNGIDIGRINYQDNSNWSVFKPEGPYFHLHIYGRARSATYQKYGQTLHFPHRDEHPELYKNLQPLTKSDIGEIHSEVSRLFQEERYRDEQWNLN